VKVSSCEHKEQSCGLGLFFLLLQSCHPQHRLACVEQRSSYRCCSPCKPHISLLEV
jgi:hypothetical protein